MAQWPGITVSPVELKPSLHSPPSFVVCYSLQKYHDEKKTKWRSCNTTNDDGGGFGGGRNVGLFDDRRNNTSTPNRRCGQWNNSGDTATSDRSSSRSSSVATITRIIVVIVVRKRSTSSRSFTASVRLFNTDTFGSQSRNVVGGTKVEAQAA